jgi:pyruvate dehydrogenase E2 component (dihydrolipoamide acetyltransferase)
VQGSGPRGRILAEDVQGYTKQALAGGGAGAPGGAGIPAMPAVDFSQWGDVEHTPLARIRRISAQYLHRAWLNVPHVTQHDEADITELEAFRKAQSEEGGVKLTLLPFVMKAVGAALRQFPEFNASLAPGGESLILKKYCNIGFAADTEAGLVVPVVKDVWGKGIVALAQECAELAKKARDGKLKPDEMKGGCFSISSLGGIGGGHFTPIVNAPEVAILGVSRAQMKPHWNGSEFVPRLMCPLSLSYDHRVIDGAAAARFIVALGKLLTDLRRLAL